MKTLEYAVPSYITATELKRVRGNLRLTQREFANLVGCSKPTIERWETSTGKITGPIVLLVHMLDKYPEELEELEIPEKKYPLRLRYMHDDTLCTIIDVDEMHQKVRIKNYANHIMFRAFGVNEKPTFEDYREFLKSRCFPETRDKMKLILKEMGLPFYDPFLIIKKTEGRMAEDHFWIKIER